MIHPVPAGPEKLAVYDQSNQLVDMIDPFYLTADPEGRSNGEPYQNQEEQWCQDLFEDETGSKVTAVYSLPPPEGATVNWISRHIHRLYARRDEKAEKNVILIEILKDVQIDGVFRRARERFWTTPEIAAFQESMEYATVIFPE